MREGVMYMDIGTNTTTAGCCAAELRPWLAVQTVEVGGVIREGKARLRLKLVAGPTSSSPPGGRPHEENRITARLIIGWNLSPIMPHCTRKRHLSIHHSLVLRR